MSATKAATQVLPENTSRTGAVVAPGGFVSDSCQLSVRAVSLERLDVATMGTAGGPLVGSVDDDSSRENEAARNDAG